MIFRVRQSVLPWLLASFLFAFLTASGLQAQAAASYEPLSSGFESIKLGMDFDAVENLLLQSSSFDFRGEPEVSFNPERNEKIIQTAGGRYINRAVFQFRDGKLFLITLMFEPRYLDFYLLHTRLSEKYGPPKSLDPEKMLWEQDTIRMVLEKPQTLKYIDQAVMNQIIQEQEIQKSVREESLDAFIKKL